MCQVNMFKAKTDLSKLIIMLERGDEREIIIARNGTPVAKLVCYEKPKKKSFLGIGSDNPNLKKVCAMSDAEWDAMDKEIEEMFMSSKIFPNGDI